MKQRFSLPLGVVVKEFTKKVICTSLPMKWKSIIQDLNRKEWGKLGQMCCTGF